MKKEVHLFELVLVADAPEKLGREPGILRLAHLEAHDAATPDVEKKV